MKTRLNVLFSVIIIIAFICVLNYLIQTNKELFLDLKAYGYIGTFLACLLLNSTVLLPSSSTAVVMSMATIYNPVIVGIVGALGSTFGEYTGYFAGWFGRTLVDENNLFQKILAIYNKSPELAIMLFAILPFPLFDVIGILAGSSRMKACTFFVFCLIGKTIKMLFYAFLGIYALEYIQGII